MNAREINTINKALDELGELAGRIRRSRTRPQIPENLVAWATKLDMNVQAIRAVLRIGPANTTGTDAGKVEEHRAT